VENHHVGECQRQYNGEQPSSSAEMTLYGQRRPAVVKIEATEMIVKKLNKHELKTKETRELLLQAAETIFGRDGYEGAELGEIASLAGRTKGAIYAQFESKEDIFLALIEDQRLRYRAQMEKLLAESTSVDDNLKALRRFYTQITEDQRSALLMLEFKLFTIRHPNSKKKLQKFFSESISLKDEKRLAGILGPAGKGKNAISRVVAIQTLTSMLSALLLESKVSPALIGEGVVRKVTDRVFDALFEDTATRS
jgi:AcrR family transcriptional regulator